MYKLFKRFDYLSSEVNFTFNFRGDIIHKTIFGGIISMLSIFIYSLQMKKLDFTNLIRLNLILIIEILTMEQSKVLL